MADTQTDLWEEEREDALLGMFLSIPAPEDDDNNVPVETDPCSSSSSSLP